jgi:hypothetical protein
MKKSELIDAAPLMAAVLGPATIAIRSALSRPQALDALCRLDYLDEVRAWATLILQLISAAIAHAAAGGGAAAIVVRIVCAGLGLRQWN